MMAVMLDCHRVHTVMPVMGSVVPTPTTGRRRFRTSRVVVVPLPYSRSKTFRVFFFFFISPSFSLRLRRGHTDRHTRIRPLKPIYYDARRRRRFLILFFKEIRVDSSLRGIPRSPFPLSLSSSFSPREPHDISRYPATVLTHFIPKTKSYRASRGLSKLLFRITAFSWDAPPLSYFLALSFTLALFLSPSLAL